jgi:hypothetical protein
MTESWFHRLEGDVRRDWQRATHPFSRHGSTIAGNRDLPPQGATAMPTLLELSNTVKEIAEAAEVPLRALLDEHVPALVQLGQQVENSKLIQGAIRAEESLPPGIRDSIAALLEATVDQFETPAAAQSAEVQQPAA